METFEAIYRKCGEKLCLANLKENVVVMDAALELHFELMFIMWPEPTDIIESCDQGTEGHEMLWPSCRLC